jgi:hypothetical protein
VADRKKPASPTDFAALVPEEYRAATVEKTERTERGRKDYGEKKRVAERIDSMRNKGTDKNDTAIREHDFKNHVAGLEASKRPRGSRRQRRSDAFIQRGKRLRRRMEAHVEKQTAKLKALGQHDANPVGVPPEVWRTSELIMGDETAHTARIMIASLPRTVARRIMNAALTPEPYKGKRKRRGITLRDPSRAVLDGHRKHWESPGKRRWTHPVAIRTVAIGVALWKLGRRTRRNGFSKVTRGIPREMVAALVQDHNTGVRPHVNTLFGNHRGTPGDVRALEVAGLFQVNQPPGSKVAARDRGPSGFAYNVYWWPPFTLRGEKPTTEAEEEIERLSAVGLRAQLGLEDPPPRTTSTIADR